MKTIVIKVSNPFILDFKDKSKQLLMPFYVTKINKIVKNCEINATYPGTNDIELQLYFSIFTENITEKQLEDIRKLYFIDSCLEELNSSGNCD